MSGMETGRWPKGPSYRAHPRLYQGGVRQESWQRIGGESPPRVRTSHPPRPRVSAASREGRREAFTGETTGQVLSCETGLIPRCRSHSAEEKATSSHGECCMGRTSRSRRPCARETFLRGTWEVSSVSGEVCRPARKATSARRACTWMRSRMRHSTYEATEQGRQLPAEVVEGRASPKGNSR